VSTCSFSCSPGQPTGTWRWTSFPGSASAAPQPVRLPSGGQGYRRCSCQPRTTNVRPSLPRQAQSGSGDHAARRPQRHVEPGSPTVVGPATPTSGIQHGADSAAAAAADIGRLAVRTPGSPRSYGRQSPGHRTPGHRSPGHRTSARPGGRTSVRMADSATNGVAGVRTSWTATTTAMPAGRPKPRSGCSVCGARSP
jgi:hypothetical protein